MEVSIDEPLNVDWDGNELLLSDILGTDENVIYNKMEEEVNYHLLYKALAKLSPREKTIIQLRFGIRTADGEEKTQKEIADFLGISQSYISRLGEKDYRTPEKRYCPYGRSLRPEKDCSCWTFWRLHLKCIQSVERIELIE